MSVDATAVAGAVVVGVGATVFMDVWASFARRVLGIAAGNYCLVGRWLSYMPEGTFVHASIADAPPKRFECAVGWIGHYVIGVAYALALVAIVSDRWLERPTALPALTFGIVTVLVPFLVMQPSFGLGLAASKAPDPTQARLRSLMAHASFGVGLYLSALVVSAVRRGV